MEKTLLISSLLLPLISFFVLFESRSIKRHAGWLSTILFFIGFVIAGIQLFQPNTNLMFEWFHTSEYSLSIHFRTDPIAKSMTTLVYFIALLVNLYSIKYMKGEVHYHKYFGYLGLFTFSMLGIVLFNNLLFIYGFWELVGLSSYLLIGFWYQRPQATMASKKAFIINRIGDIGFLVGILLLWSQHKSLDINFITNIPLTGTMLETTIALCLFCGCIGKSAQFPLQIWLPDAMQGPTPASALIHAATMVAAGIYLMIRVLTLCPPDALVIFGLIGSTTAFIAAITACVQYDIKKILAYSTISQLGYMVVALSTGKGEVAYLHLFTHAFFKAGLFLCAGAIIHEIAHQRIKINNKSIDPQDIRLMGGLSKSLKITYWAYLLCYISAVGIPLSGGFISKDFIIGNLLDKNLALNSFTSIFTLVLTLITISLTAFYMTRQLILVFWSTNRAKINAHWHETPKIMLIPIFLLGIGSLYFFYSINPLDAHKSYLVEYIGTANHEIVHHNLAIGLSISLTFAGILFAYLTFRNYTFNTTQKQSKANSIAFNHFYINKLYMRIIMPISLQISKNFNLFDRKIIDNSIDKFGTLNVITAHVLKINDQYIIDGLYSLFVWFGNLIADFGKSLQSKKIQNYFLNTIVLVTIILLIYYLWN